MSAAKIILLLGDGTSNVQASAIFSCFEKSNFCLIFSRLHLFHHYEEQLVFPCRHLPFLSIYRVHISGPRLVPPLYMSATPIVTPPTSTTHIAAPKAPYSTGDNRPAALLPLALAEGLELIIMVLEAVAEAGIEDRADACVNVALRPVALVQAEGADGAEPETKFTAAHY